MAELIIHDGTSIEHPDLAGGFKGLIPRDYNTHPQGCYASAPPASIKLIDRAEWPQRIRDMVAAKARLSDIREIGNFGKRIPSRDQNGKGYCATADTEVLTQKGWVAYPNYNWTDPIATVNRNTHAMEFQVPFQKHIYEYNGTMLYSTNRRLDFGVTPDHQMYVRKWNEKKRTLSEDYSFVCANDLGWYSGMLAAPSGHVGTELVEVAITGDRHYDGDDLIALLGLLCSDGYAGGSEATQNWVSFCCFNESRYDMVKALAGRVGFAEKPSQRGVFIRYDAPALATWVRGLIYENDTYKAESKCIPSFVKVSSERQLKIFLKFFGDQNHGEDAQVVFYSRSERMIDDLQELHLRVGKRATVTKRGPRTAVMSNGKIIESNESYVLYVASSNKLCIERKKHIERDGYKGLVYCAGVPNHTLLTRRNGSVLVSSNCWAHSPTAAAIMLRAIANLPYADLSAYAVACIIKGYRDEGGWGALALDFIMNRGIPTSEFWPQQSVNSSHDNPETWANAAKYKITAGFIDLAAPVYNRKMSFDQFYTCLLMGLPVVIDLNWWGHSVCALDPVDGVAQRDTCRTESGKLATVPEFELIYGINDEVTGGASIRIWNSWGDSWSENGLGVLTGSKAVPDAATAPHDIRATA